MHILTTDIHSITGHKISLVDTWQEPNCWAVISVAKDGHITVSHMGSSLSIAATWFEQLMAVDCNI